MQTCGLELEHFWSCHVLSFKMVDLPQITGQLSWGTWWTWWTNKAFCAKKSWVVVLLPESLRSIARKFETTSWWPFHFFFSNLCREKVRSFWFYPPVIFNGQMTDPPLWEGNIHYFHWAIFNIFYQRVGLRFFFWKRNKLGLLPRSTLLPWEGFIPWAAPERHGGPQRRIGEIHQWFWSFINVNWPGSESVEVPSSTFLFWPCFTGIFRIFPEI